MKSQFHLKENINGILRDLIDFLNTSFYSTQILALTSQPSPNNKVNLLRFGADECLTVNFNHEELLLRTKKLLNRQKISQPHIIQLSDVTVYPKQGLVSINKKRIYLRKKEINILEYLYRHKNTVVSRRDLVNALWRGQEPSLNTIDTYIRRIRKVLGKNRNFINTIWGYGYMLTDY